VLQAPPPVVARSLGFDYGTATEHAIAAGGTWNRYPAARRDSTLAPLHPSPRRGALTSRLTAVLRAAADGLPAGEAAQLTITRSDRVRWAAAVQYATAWAASSTGLL
jgi:DNA-binding NarL/FixJ family response regulator